MGQPGNNGYINSRSTVCRDSKEPDEHHVMSMPTSTRKNRLSCQESHESAANQEQFDNPDLLERALSSPNQNYDPHFIFSHDVSLSSMVCDLKTLIAAHTFCSNNFTQSTSCCAMFDTAVDSLASSSSSYILPQGSSQSFRSCTDLNDRIHTIGHVQGFDMQLELPMNALSGHQPTSHDFGEIITLTKEAVHNLPATGSSCTVDSCPSGLANSLQSSSVVELHASEMPGNNRDSAASPNKTGLTVQSPENSDTDRQNQGTKKRRVQQKRVVCVPLAGDGKQRIEAPPSDDWAWRKYGQKPIKGSPYPRGYYRCSSAKGCSARKQVERSRSDPSMLLITYTSDHNHSWPVHRSSSPGVPNHPQSSLETDSNHKHEPSECEPFQNLFLSIIDSPDDARDEHMLPSFESIHVGQEPFSSDKNANSCRLRPPTEEEEEDFFDELGELPELAAIFRNGFLEEKSCPEIVSTNADYHSISGWSSGSFMESKVVC